jgi:hypothetical protein
MDKEEIFGIGFIISGIACFCVDPNAVRVDG